MKLLRNDYIPWQSQYTEVLEITPVLSGDISLYASNRLHHINSHVMSPLRHYTYILSIRSHLGDSILFKPVL